MFVKTTVGEVPPVVEVGAPLPDDTEPSMIVQTPVVEAHPLVECVTPGSRVSASDESAHWRLRNSSENSPSLEKEGEEGGERRRRQDGGGQAGCGHGPGQAN